MSRWPELPFLEVARLIRGTEPGSGSYTDSTKGVRFLRVGDITGKSDRPVFTDSQQLVTVSRSDILLALDGTPGHVSTGHEGAISSGIRKVVPLKTNKVLREWLRYALMSPDVQRTIRQHTNGVTILHASSAVPHIKMSVPPMPEQERYVRILDEAETLRRLRAQSDQRVATLIPALFDEMFGDPSAKTCNWPMADVSSLVERFQAGRSIAPAGEETATGKYRILKISAVTCGRFVPGESKPVPDTIAPAPEHFVRAGDMLFSRANTTELVGATALVETTPDNLLLPDKLWRFVWKKPVAIEPRFALALFQHPAIRLELGNRATGTGGSMKNLSMGKVLSMKIPLPPVKLQHTFAVRVADIHDLETAQTTSRQRLDELFKSLLHRALQGEL
jgi:type I restriction enzyme S subunit